MDSTGRDAEERPPTGQSVRAALWAAAACGALAVLAAILTPLAARDGSELLAVVVVLVPLLAAFALAGLALARLRAEREEIAARAELAQRLADQDALTGVGNYRAFWRALRGECARADRYGAPFTLAVIDLDDFKRVNDEHGHRAGDHALRAVADALRGAVRAEDTLCRQGGDEFAVVAVAAGVPEASALAARLASAVAAAEMSPDVAWRPHASVGTATYGPDGTTPEEIMATADASLGAAKSALHGGGTRVLRARAPRRPGLAGRVRRG